MIVRKSEVRIVETVSNTIDEDVAETKLNRLLPNGRYDKMRISLWNLVRPDMAIDTQDEWVIFEVIV